MAFTGVLGTSDSYLGNIVLGTAGGGGGGNIANESITLTTVGGFSSLAIGEYYRAITLTVTADILRKGGFLLDESLTIAAIDEIEFTTVLDEVLSVSGISALSAKGGFNLNGTITLSGISDFYSPGGIVYTSGIGLETYSSITLFSGFTYTDTLDIEGISDIALLELYYKHEILAIDGVSDLDLTVNYNAQIALSIASIADLISTNTGEIYNSIILTTAATIYIDQIYDFLIVSAAISSFSATNVRLINPTELASSAGSVSMSCQAIYLRVISQTLTLTQTVVAKRPTAIFSQNSSFSQTITVQKVKNLSVTHSLSLTQEAEQSREIDQDIIFNQEIDYLISKPKAINQTLVFSQSIFVNKTYNRSIEDTLLFNINKETFLPMLGGTQYSYFAPLINFVLVPRRCLVILSVPSQTVVLPCPLFGDSQAYQGSLTLKRTMTGGTRTYVKQTQLQQLEYSFEIWTTKYLELRQFVLNHSSKQIRLDNWKGESWVVNIMNNPVEFAAEGRYQPKGEKYTVTLQFKGVKING